MQNQHVYQRNDAGSPVAWVEVVQDDNSAPTATGKARKEGCAMPANQYRVRWECTECDHVYIAEYESEEGAILAELEGGAAECPRHGTQSMTGEPVD